MSLKIHISVFFFALVAILCNAQKTTHDFIGSASDTATVQGFGNISWSIGEVVVFDETPNSTFSIAQAMQSYPPFKQIDNCPTITVKGDSVNLCGSSSFTTKLNYTAAFPLAVSTTPVVDSVQWYFNDGQGWTKIAGATSKVNTQYQPFFPGQYQVCVRYAGNICIPCSAPVEVKSFSVVTSHPNITASGSPTTQLTASVSGSPTSLQWYVYVDNVGKYLLIAGGANAAQNVRYDGDYMIIATYAGGCRLSSFYTVSGYNRSIQRASDVTYDANTIYIPDETAFSDASLKVYPNPAIGQFFVQYQSSTEITTNAELYSNTGIFIKEIVFTEGGTWARSAKVSTEELSAGVYFIKVNQEAKHLVQKVVVYK